MEDYVKEVVSSLSLSEDTIFTKISEIEFSGKRKEYISFIGKIFLEQPLSNNC